MDLDEEIRKALAGEPMPFDDLEIRAYMRGLCEKFDNFDQEEADRQDRVIEYQKTHKCYDRYELLKFRDSPFSLLRPNIICPTISCWKREVIELELKKRPVDDLKDEPRRDDGLVLSPQKGSNFKMGCQVAAGLVFPEMAISPIAQSLGPAHVPRRIGSGRLVNREWETSDERAFDGAHQVATNIIKIKKPKGEPHVKPPRPRNYDEIGTRIIRNSKSVNGNAFRMPHKQHGESHREMHNHYTSQVPEWFTEGPTSRHDRIDLHGFDGPYPDDEPEEEIEKMPVGKSEFDGSNAVIKEKEPSPPKPVADRVFVQSEVVERAYRQPEAVARAYRQQEVVERAYVQPEVVERVIMQPEVEAQKMNNSVPPTGHDDFNFDDYMQMDVLSPILAELDAEHVPPMAQEKAPQSRFSQFFGGQNNSYDPPAQKQHGKMPSSQPPYGPPPGLPPTMAPPPAMAPPPTMAPPPSMAPPPTMASQPIMTPPIRLGPPEIIPPPKSLAQQPIMGSPQTMAPLPNLNSAASSQPDAATAFISAFCKDQPQTFGGNFKDMAETLKMHSVDELEARVIATSSAPPTVTTPKRPPNFHPADGIRPMHTRRFVGPVGRQAPPLNIPTQYRDGLPPMPQDVHYMIANTIPSQDILNRPDYLAIVSGVKQGIISAQHLLNLLLKGNLVMHPRQRDVVICVLNTICTSHKAGNPITAPVPSRGELVAHTANIMQNALIKKKLEEQFENFKKRQDSDNGPPPAQTTRNASPNPGQMQSSLSFTPTSVLRKMTVNSNVDVFQSPNTCSTPLPRTASPNSPVDMDVAGASGSMGMMSPFNVEMHGSGGNGPQAPPLLPTPPFNPMAKPMPRPMAKPMPRPMAKAVPKSVAKPMPNLMATPVPLPMPNLMAKPVPNPMASLMGNPLPNLMANQMPNLMANPMPNPLPNLMANTRSKPKANQMPNAMPNQMTGRPPKRLNSQALQFLLARNNSRAASSGSNDAQWWSSDNMGQNMKGDKPQRRMGANANANATQMLTVEELERKQKQAIEIRDESPLRSPWRQ